jgi:hypothetical protein
MKRVFLFKRILILDLRVAKLLERGTVCANAGMMTAFWLLLVTGTGSLARWLVKYSQSNIYLNLKGL